MAKSKQLLLSKHIVVVSAGLLLVLGFYIGGGRSNILGIQIDDDSSMGLLRILGLLSIFMAVRLFAQRKSMTIDKIYKNVFIIGSLFCLSYGFDVITRNTEVVESVAGGALILISGLYIGYDFTKNGFRDV